MFTLFIRGIRLQTDSLFLLLCERWEQDSSHLRDGLLVGHGKTVVKSLWADNTVLSCIHDEASQTWLSWVLWLVWWQKVLLIDGHVAWNVFFALESLNLSQHKFFVLFDSIVNDSLECVHIAFPASENHLWLDQFNQSLDKEVLEQLGVLLWVVLKSSVHCLACVLS